MGNSNRRNNGIESLMVDGILSSDQGRIVDCITQFFMNFFLISKKKKNHKELSNTINNL